MRRILLALALFAAVTLCSLRAQERLPELLLEQFTGERCPACPGGAKTIKSTINSMVSECRVSWIAHHAGYYTDFLTLPESQQLQHLFRIGGGTGTYAPAFMINRAKIDGTVVSKVRTDSIKKRVYDVAGRLMPMSNLAPGVYVVRVETHTGIYTHKVQVS